ncbi:hypothetical protein SNE40_004195 [Patella caerulea]|uniref:VWFA domain-containing protein n=1 Tax=Patella caerulea TaxID=87958 RepID=A0AAN8KFY8_PATCE
MEFKSLFIVFALFPLVVRSQEEYCGGKPADVVFLLDASNSIWGPDFKKQLEFVQNIVSMFNIGENYTQVGMATFNRHVDLQFHLNSYHRKEDLIEAIGLVEETYGDATNTADAVRFMRREMFSQRHGSRKGVPKVGVIITDGQSSNILRTVFQASRAKRQHINLFAIGVGDLVNVRELRGIASKPSMEYMFQVLGYGALGSVRNILAVRTCAVSGRPKKLTTPVFIRRTTTKNGRRGHNTSTSTKNQTATSSKNVNPTSDITISTTTKVGNMPISTTMPTLSTKTSIEQSSSDKSNVFGRIGPPTFPPFHNPNSKLEAADFTTAHSENTSPSGGVPTGPFDEEQSTGFPNSEDVRNADRFSVSGTHHTPKDQTEDSYSGDVNADNSQNNNHDTFTANNNPNNNNNKELTNFDNNNKKFRNIPNSNKRLTGVDNQNNKTTRPNVNNTGANHHNNNNKRLTGDVNTYNNNKNKDVDNPYDNNNRFTDADNPYDNNKFSNVDHESNNKFTDVNNPNNHNKFTNDNNPNNNNKFTNVGKPNNNNKFSYVDNPNKQGRNTDAGNENNNDRFTDAETPNNKNMLTDGDNKNNNYWFTEDNNLNKNPDNIFRGVDNPNNRFTNVNNRNNDNDRFTDTDTPYKQNQFTDAENPNSNNRFTDTDNLNKNPNKDFDNPNNRFRETDNSNNDKRFTNVGNSNNNNNRFTDAENQKNNNKFTGTYNPNRNTKFTNADNGQNSGRFPDADSLNSNQNNRFRGVNNPNNGFKNTDDPDSNNNRFTNADNLNNNPNNRFRTIDNPSNNKGFTDADNTNNNNNRFNDTDNPNFNNRFTDAADNMFTGTYNPNNNNKFTNADNGNGNKRFTDADYLNNQNKRGFDNPNNGFRDSNGPDNNNNRFTNVDNLNNPNNNNRFTNADNSNSDKRFTDADSPNKQNHITDADNQKSNNNFTGKYNPNSDNGHSNGRYTDADDLNNNHNDRFPGVDNPNNGLRNTNAPDNNNNNNNQFTDADPHNNNNRFSDTDNLNFNNNRFNLNNNPNKRFRGVDNSRNSNSFTDANNPNNDNNRFTDADNPNFNNNRFTGVDNLNNNPNNRFRGVDNPRNSNSFTGVNNPNNNNHRFTDADNPNNNPNNRFRGVDNTGQNNRFTDTDNPNNNNDFNKNEFTYNSNYPKGFPSSYNSNNQNRFPDSTIPLDKHRSPGFSDSDYSNQELPRCRDVSPSSSGAIAGTEEPTSEGNNNPTALPNEGKEKTNTTDESNSGDEDKATTTTTTTTPPPKPTERTMLEPACRNKEADIVFAIDSSNGINRNDYWQQIRFVREVARRMDIGENKTRVGLIVYTDQVMHQFDLSDHTNMKPLLEAIISSRRSAGGTRIDNAVRYVRTKSFRRSLSRPNAAQVAVFIAGSKSRNIHKTKKEAGDARSAGMTLFSIGVGKGYSKDEMHVISKGNKGWGRHGYFVDDFDKIETIIKDLTIQACRTKPTETPLTNLSCGFRQQADLMFVVDSANAGRTNTKKTLEFVRDVSKSVDIDKDNVHVGLMSAGCDAGQEGFSLGAHRNEKAMKDAISRNQRGTDISKLLKDMRRNSFSSKEGGRKDAKKVAVVVVDGQLEQPLKALREARFARIRGVEVYVVAVGNGKVQKEIEMMCDDPLQKHFFRVENYDQLKGLKTDLVDMFCDEL